MYYHNSEYIFVSKYKYNLTHIHINMHPCTPIYVGIYCWIDAHTHTHTHIYIYRER